MTVPIEFTATEPPLVARQRALIVRGRPPNCKNQRPQMRHYRCEPHVSWTFSLAAAHLQSTSLNVPLQNMPPLSSCKRRPFFDFVGARADRKGAPGCADKVARSSARERHPGVQPRFRADPIRATTYRPRILYISILLVKRGHCRQRFGEARLHDAQKERTQPSGFSRKSFVPSDRELHEPLQPLRLLAPRGARAV